MTPPFVHMPVLCAEIVDTVSSALCGSDGEVHSVETPLIIDGTVGGGGHSAALLERFEHAQLLGFDRDKDALNAAAAHLAPYAGRFRLVHDTFDNIAQHMEPGRGADVILIDIGVSSHQLDAHGRGFSFRGDAPLDMRMDQSHGAPLRDLLADLSHETLTQILRDYGEERFSGRIARSIIEDLPQTTADLARSIYRVYPKKARDSLRIDPATRTFQALRIYINDELGQLERWLRVSPSMLAPHGLALVISFHSLEDRLVKRAFARWAGRCICPPEIPICQCHPPEDFEILTRKPVTASSREAQENPRARSAKLRVLRRVAHGGAEAEVLL